MRSAFKSFGKGGRLAGRESRLLPSVLDAIGNTPLIDLSRLVENTPGASGRLLAKLENLNPGLSKKDRIALQMLDEARASGELEPGQTVCELTSGNTGTGLAIVCGVLGHPCVLVMSEGNSIERVRMMRALGAEVILVPQLPGSIKGQVSGADLDQVFIRCAEVVEERGAFRADQFELLSNFNAHYNHTGPEIWQQSEGTVTAFVDFAGSGGTFGGVSRFLKEQQNDIQCFCVEPEGCAVIAGKEVTDPNHRIQGGGYMQHSLTNMKALLDDEMVDGFLQVSDKQAIHATRRLAQEEGIFGGFSAGANVAAGLELLCGECHGGSVAVVVCDSGLKYLSTDLWE